MRLLSFTTGFCLLWVMLASGCASTIAPRPGDASSYEDQLGAFAQLPRARMGALPFYGPFTLYDRADLDELGTHSYARGGLLDFDNERERGIVYTRRAGFFDIAHVRNSADMTAYIYARAQLAIEQGWTAFTFKGHEPSTYTVSLCYPPDWYSIPIDERAQLGDELALRVAQRIAFDVMTWHEIITWHGYKSVIVVSEKKSAFTHDDVPSHAMGVQLAAEAIRSGKDFDLEMSDRLHAMLTDLGIVDAQTHDDAIKRVKNQWWSTIGGPERRMLDIGTGDGVVEPWVIQSLAEGERHDFKLAALDNINGRDFSGFYRVQIDPKVLEGFKIRSVLNTDREYIDPEIDFPVLLRAIAEQLEDHHVDAIPQLAIN